MTETETTILGTDTGTGITLSTSATLPDGEDRLWHLTWPSGHRDDMDVHMWVAVTLLAKQWMADHDRLWTSRDVKLPGHPASHPAWVALKEADENELRDALVRVGPEQRERLRQILDGSAA